LSAKTELSGPTFGIHRRREAANVPFVHHPLEIFGNRQGSPDWMQTGKLLLNILAGERFCELIFSNWQAGDVQPDHASCF
jgi:hypothetical protein